VNGETDAVLIGYAVNVWPVPPGTTFRIEKYGEGVCVMADLPDGTVRIKWGADHPEARLWLTLILRRHHVALERERRRAREQETARTRLIARGAGVRAPYTRPSLSPWPPAPYPSAPSYRPPAAEDPEEERRRRQRDEEEQTFFAGALAVVADALTSSTRSDEAPTTSSAAPDFGGGGGESGGGGASGSWDSGSSSCGGSSDSGGGGGDD
jgi:hypothetical protein